MGKKERLQRRVNRIDARFKEKVRKGKKGTDTDIQYHEDRIGGLAKKGGFTAPFMAKSPLRNDSKCSSLRSQLEAQQEKLAKIKAECGGNISCQGEKGIDTVQETISILKEQIVSNKC